MLKQNFWEYTGFWPTVAVCLVVFAIASRPHVFKIDAQRKAYMAQQLYLADQMYETRN